MEEIDAADDADERVLQSQNTEHLLQGVIVDHLAEIARKDEVIRKTGEAIAKLQEELKVKDRKIASLSEGPSVMSDVERSTWTTSLINILPVSEAEKVSLRKLENFNSAITTMKKTRAREASRNISAVFTSISTTLFPESPGEVLPALLSKRGVMNELFPNFKKCASARLGSVLSKRGR